MNVVIAVDSFKGSLSSIEAGESIKRGILAARNEDIKVEVCSMADGGEGTIDTILHSIPDAKIKELMVNGPLSLPVASQFVVFSYQGEEHVFIECASSCGLTLIPAEKRNPMKTNTYGFGQQIAAAIKNGYRHFFLSLGGSATNDGGMGMLQALGWDFYQNDGSLIGTEANPLLQQVASMSCDNVLKELAECQFTIASDVLNPFYGPNGAAYVFARQKGASDADISELDEALKRFAGVLEKSIDVDVQQVSGAGAAGGLGGAIVACLGARMMSGAELIIEITGLAEKIKQAHLVITGEGSLDRQSLLGKVPVAVAKWAKRYGKPVFGIAGRMDTELAEINQHIDAVFSIQTQCRTLEEAMLDSVTRTQLEVTAEQIMRVYLCGIGQSSANR